MKGGIVERMLYIFLFFCLILGVILLLFYDDNNGKPENELEISDLIPVLETIRMDTSNRTEKEVLTRTIEILNGLDEEGYVYEQ